MTIYYARKEYTYSTGDAIFSIPFDYIKKENIAVFINDIETENYTYLNSSQIQVNDVLEAGDIVAIVRNTPIDNKMVEFSDTSILNKNTQNLAQDQVFNAIQEVYDNNIIFNQDTLDLIAANKAEIEQQIEDFEDEINNTIEEVEKAAQKINEMEEAVETAKGAAQTATDQADNASSSAQLASDKADVATEKAQEVSEALSTKQDTLVSEENIKSINGVSLLGSGNYDTPYKILGEKVTSPIPLNDAALHPFDGGIVNRGSYKDFVDYIADLYEQDPTATYFTHAKTTYNINEIGSLINNDGVITGFGDDSYFLLPNNFNTGNNSWEIVNKFTTNDDFSVGQIIVHPENSSAVNLALWITTAGKLSIHGSSTGSSWNLFTDVLSQTTLEPSTTYYTKFEFTGTAYNLYLSEDGENWNLECSVNSTVCIIQNTKLRFGSFPDGRYVASIDLNESYININGSLWWEGRTDYTAEQIWQQIVSKYGSCDKFVYDEENKTVRVPKYSNEHGHLIKSYSQGTTHYRIYADGWCEQSWHANCPSTINTTIGLPIPFVDTNYTVVGDLQDVGDTSICTLAAYPATKSTFYAMSAYNGTGFVNSCNWYACGYVDISDYQYSPIYEYLVIATVTKTNLQVNIDEIATDLNNKVDKTDLQEVQCVVETYTNGSSWYRVYSDGWCEQGGCVNKTWGSSTFNGYTIVFCKPFVDINYTFMKSTSIDSASATGAYASCSSYATGTKFTTSISTGTELYSSGFCWQANGYIEV